jgi:hypothetical protein
MTLRFGEGVNSEAWFRKVLTKVTSRALLKRSYFTLLEISIALAIFAVSVTALIDQRNHAVDKSFLATQQLQAMTIIDEVMAEYYLYPFDEEPRALPRDYEPFEVDVDVARESINIVPEEWRLEVFEDELDPKKLRIILKVTVTVKYKGLDGIEEHQCEASTLIRLIQLDEDGFEQEGA